ncbi:hypothetical protein EYF80_023617 [Liparis tanakae]|uniref:Uncharacterized protein n=1 Tax=Liparis tanakae TaxID=230148 RepID=A0A4Z2HJR2_9TELE|nr:hypothetical protein EYF80_023617 [Liparis tanakae]
MQRCGKMMYTDSGFSRLAWDRLMGALIDPGNREACGRILMVTTSSIPACSSSCSCTAETPFGVPVRMRSPSSRVMNSLM